MLTFNEMPEALLPYMASKKTKFPSRAGREKKPKQRKGKRKKVRRKSPKHKKTEHEKKGKNKL